MIARQCVCVYICEMRTIRDFRNMPDEFRGSAAAIGNFDGVHLGHLQVINRAKDSATARGAKPAVVTFEPHPRQHFAPNAPPFRLMNAEAKARRMETIGVELMFELPFDKSLAGLSASEFSRDILSDGLGIRCAVVGEDFRFGKGRLGDAGQLTEHGAEFGFDTCIVPIAGGTDCRWSSTSVRSALSDGRTGDAAGILGHWHRIEGQVLPGERRGRELGFPTANISLENLHPPRFGVYAVFVDVLTGTHRGRYEGSASIGVRPTFGGESANLEVFILDFAGDIYGESISVALVEFQRPEEVFPSADELIRQMALDCDRSREVLEAHA